MALKPVNLEKLKKRLVNNRCELWKQVVHLEAEREELEQRFIEPIDTAQKEDLARLVNKLVERGKEEIGEIDLSLEKMNSGSYGICELCGRSIPFKRLKALPATRLCRNCVEKYETSQKLHKHHRDEIISDELLNEYRDLNDETDTIGSVKHPDG